ncbi:Adenylyl-sulfate kinase 2 [Citrus sinensis]|uniref:APS kinase domain-containing protein n=1 Tax=Citrus sinensis TaxID=2711 RepID=A0A067GGP3_CITSI|nr:Adenylyl-sulfate kinase 2 [Citrus sinensis]KDO78883.1 hypothetical protein CISIN_1g023675mg [Citrus sinensis]
MEKVVAVAVGATRPAICSPSLAEVDFRTSVKMSGFFNVSRLRSLQPIKALEESATASVVQESAAISGNNLCQNSTVAKSTNILWHKNSVDKRDRQQLLQQKGCVIWITGLSGSGKSTLACALSQALHWRGKLTYILDGDNCRHGLNRDLSFKAEDRVENIRRIEKIEMPAVQCCQKEISLRCSWMCHFKCVRQGTQRAFTSLHEKGRSRVLLGLMIHMNHH